jgi:4-amino-4-deoxy-L-arabinose transferase-like glycosyltransferase
MTTAPARARAAPSWPAWLGFAAIVAFSIAGHLYWLRQNSVQIGHDAAGHLSRTLKIAALLDAPAPGGLLGAFLRALTFTDFRPPALYLSAQGFYDLLGRTPDVAQLAVLAWLAAALLFTFLLARRLAGDGLALVAAAVAALLPMSIAMSRLFYVEMAVAACVIASLYFLVASERFAHTGMALGLGAALGVGLLAKWTLPVYLAAPLLIALWQARPLRAASAPPVPRRTRLLRSLAAVLLAAATAALLYRPDRARWDALALGAWLPVAWFALFAAFGLALAQPPAPRRNVLAAFLLAAAVASLWYLPQSSFAPILADVAWGTGEGDYPLADYADWRWWVRYPRMFAFDHLGLLPALLVMGGGLLPWLWQGRAWLRAQPEALLLWASFLSPFVLLIFTSQSQTRNLVAILPVFAVLAALGLRAWRQPWRGLLVAAWIVALGTQWALVTFDRLGPLHAASAPLWAVEKYAIRPATGVADPRYAIVDDVLATIQATTPASTTLGILLDTPAIHQGAFEYPILNRALPVELASLNGPNLTGRHDVIANQWVLLKDGDNREMAPLSQQVSAEIQAGALWFDRLYSRAAAWTLPDGDTVTLYRRAAGPAAPYQFSTILYGDLPPIAEVVRSWWSDAATLVFTDADTAVWLGTQEAPLDRVVIPAPGARLTPADLEEAAGTMIVVSRYDTPEYQAWLRESLDYVQEVSSGEFTATLYGRPDRPLVPVQVDAAWPGLSLTEIETLPGLRPGEVLPVSLAPASAPETLHNISLRLLDPGGQQVAQQDTALTGGDLRLALFVPPGAPAGDYTLAALVYDAATLAPLPDNGGMELVPLTTVSVAP